MLPGNWNALSDASRCFVISEIYGPSLSPFDAFIGFFPFSSVKNHVVLDIFSGFFFGFRLSFIVVPKSEQTYCSPCVLETCAKVPKSDLPLSSWHK